MDNLGFDAYNPGFDKFNPGFDAYNPGFGHTIQDLTHTIQELAHLIWVDLGLKSMNLQSPFGCSGLERIGLERCGLVVAEAIWLERARLKRQTGQLSSPHFFFDF